MANKPVKKKDLTDIARVRVLSFDFDIEWKPCEDIKDPNNSSYDNYGLCDRRNLKIEVGEDQALQQKMHTILHEAFHASLTTGWNLLNEEDACNHFATLVIQIMRDNAWLKDYL